MLASTGFMVQSQCSYPWPRSTEANLIPCSRAAWENNISSLLSPAGWRKLEQRFFGHKPCLSNPVVCKHEISSSSGWCCTCRWNQLLECRARMRNCSHKSHYGTFLDCNLSGSMLLQLCGGRCLCSAVLLQHPTLILTITNDHVL